MSPRWANGCGVILRIRKNFVLFCFQWLHSLLSRSLRSERLSSAVGGAAAECVRDHSHLVVRSEQAASRLFKTATLGNTFKKGKAFKGIL